MVPKSISACDRQWICKTCHNALKRGLLPAQAEANNWDLDDVPVELSDTGGTSHFSSNPFHEDGCTSCGKQCAIHGPAINVPTDVTSAYTLLPRLLSQTQMVPMPKEEAMLQGALYVPVHSTSKGACSFTVVETEQLIIRGYIH